MRQQVGVPADGEHVFTHVTVALTVGDQEIALGRLVLEERETLFVINEALVVAVTAVITHDLLLNLFHGGVEVKGAQVIGVGVSDVVAEHEEDGGLVVIGGRKGGNTLHIQEVFQAIGSCVFWDSGRDCEVLCLRSLLMQPHSQLTGYGKTWILELRLTRFVNTSSILVKSKKLRFLEGSAFIPPFIMGILSTRKENTDQPLLVIKAILSRLSNVSPPRF